MADKAKGLALSITHKSNMSTIIEDVKKEVETEKLETKKAKIKKMLVLIESREKELDKTVKEYEEYVTEAKDQIAKLKDQLEKEDYSALEEIHCPGFTGSGTNLYFNGDETITYNFSC